MRIQFYIQHNPFIRLTALAILTALLSAGWIRAGETPIDKGQFNLFNPTPGDQMRPLSADRPDITESPYTVDAGHVQLEMSIADYTRDAWNEDRSKTDTWTFGATTLKLGLTNSMDLQLVFDAYTHEKVRPNPGPSQSAYGFGDTMIRLKTNLWGNDEGDAALALMPYVKIPTARDGLGNVHVEGGLIVPVGYDLGRGWGMGAMLEFAAVHDDIDRDHNFELVHSAVLGRDLFGPVGMYGEYVGIASSDKDYHYRAYAGTGITLGLTDSIQFDVGTNIGLTRASDDINVFVGVTARL